MTPNMSMEQAKQLATENAIADALQGAYGSRIAKNVFTRLEEDGRGNREVEQRVQAESMLQGEWIETLSAKTREFSEEADDGGLELWVKATVVGHARKLDVAPPAVDFRTLNRPDTAFATDFFRHEDQMYISFETPEDGFLQLYLEDEGRIYQLLPYTGQSISALNIRAGDPYVLFSTDQAHNYFPNPHFVEDEIMLTATGSDTESHRIFAVFSPDRLPLLDLRELPGGQRSLSTPDFQLQLTRLRLSRPSSVFVYATTVYVAPQKSITR